MNYQWFNFGGDPAGILDSGSIWNFRHHCVKGGIREPLAKRIWWRHLANNIALAEVPAGYDCFLVCEVTQDFATPGMFFAAPLRGKHGVGHEGFLVCEYFSVSCVGVWYCWFNSSRARLAAWVSFFIAWTMLCRTQNKKRHNFEVSRIESSSIRRTFDVFRHRGVLLTNVEARQ